MKLAKVEITNFRCFESLTINLQPDVNVFVGVNGAGKSAILDAIAIGLWDIVAANGGGGARQRGWQSVTLRPSDIHIPSESSDSISGRRDFVQIRTSATDYYEIAGSLLRVLGDETDTQAFLEWQDHIQFRPPKSFDYNNSSSNRLTDVYSYFESLWQEIRTTDSKALIPLPVVAYYRSHRRFSEMPHLGDIFSLSLDQAGAYQGALNAGADYQAMCQWFYLRENKELREKLQIRDDREYELPDLKAVRQALALVLKDVEKIYFEDTTLKVRLTEQQGAPNELELDQLSDGYRNLIAIVLDFARRLAQANPNWDNPLDAPGILLIDEIELHLHPRWQQTVIPNLQKAFPNTQIIVSTHSPQVVTTVEASNIQILESFRLRACPAPTFGAKSSDIISEVLGVSTLRPPDNPIAEKITNLFSAIDESRLEDAKALRDDLDGWAKGFPEPDLTRAALLIRRLESLQTRGSQKK